MATERDVVTLERKLDEMREFSARSFHDLARNLSVLQRDLSDMRRVLEGVMSWVGAETAARHWQHAPSDRTKLAIEFEVHPGTFMAGPDGAKKEFMCEIGIKNVGTSVPHDFQLEAHFPAEFVDINTSRQFLLRKRGESFVFRVRESNYPNERLLPGRDLKVLSIHYFVTAEQLRSLRRDGPFAEFRLKSGEFELNTNVPMRDLVVLSPDETTSLTSAAREQIHSTRV
jgi:hypothetical protein